MTLNAKEARTVRKIEDNLRKAAELTEAALDATAKLDPNKVLPYKSSNGISGQMGQHYIGTVRVAHKYVDAAAVISGKIIGGYEAGDDDAA